MLGDVSCEVFKYRILFPNNFSNSKHQIRHFISLFVRREHENIYLHSYFPEQISYDVLKPDQLEFMKPMRSNRDYEVNLLVCDKTQGFHENSRSRTTRDPGSGQR